MSASLISGNRHRILFSGLLLHIAVLQELFIQNFHPASSSVKAGTMSHISLNIAPDTYVEFNKHLLNERMNEWESAGDLGGTESKCLPLQIHTGAHQT